MPPAALAGMAQIAGLPSILLAWLRLGDLHMGIAQQQLGSVAAGAMAAHCIPAMQAHVNMPTQDSLISNPPEIFDQ